MSLPSIRRKHGKPEVAAASSPRPDRIQPALDLVNLTALMASTQGHADVAIGLVDGPVATTHPGFAGASWGWAGQGGGGACAHSGSAACLHGTFVAGVLVARRDSGAPAICPACTLVLRPIFTETASRPGGVPSARPEELAAAIVDCVRAGVRLVNLSVGLTGAEGGRGGSALIEALNLAARRGVLVVAAAGNQGVLGSSSVTRHPWVIPVSACDHRGVPVSESNFGNSIGRRGVSAPGEDIASLRSTGGMMSTSGTSVAAPIVTGAVALAWSERREATAGQVRSALLEAHSGRRRGVVPVRLDAEALLGALPEPDLAEWRNDA